MLTHSNFQEVHFFSAGGLMALDQEGIIVYSNPKAANDLFSGTAHIGMPAAKFFRESDSSTLISDRFLGSRLVDVEYELVTPGQLKNVLISTTTFADHSGTRIYLFIRDVSPLKKKERLYAYLDSATQQLSQARDTKTALDQISQLIVPRFANWFSIDLLEDGQVQELHISHGNPEMVRWAKKYREAYPIDLNSETGIARVLRSGVSDFVPFFDREKMLQSFQNPEQLEAIEQLGLKSIITVPIISKAAIKGAITFVSTADRYNYDEADLNFAKSFAIHIALALENARLNEDALKEINHRKEIEHKLTVTQLQLKSALSSGLVGTWVLDLEKGLVNCDERLAKMFGLPYSPEGYRKELFAERVHPDDRVISQNQEDDAIRNQGIYETEYRVIIDGSISWFFARGHVEKNGDHSILVGVVVDITERKKAEIDLQENEARFRFLANAIPHKLWTSSPDGSGTYYNQGWFDYTRAKSFSELNDLVWDIVHPDDLPMARAEWLEVLKRGEASSSEQRLRRYDGEYRWHLSRFSPHKDESGNIRLWVGTSTDIHDQKENEQRKDEFLSIASHELKTPLTSIKAFNQLMKRAKPDAKLNSFIEKSAEHIVKLERLITDLLDVTKLNAGKLIYTMEPFPFHQMLLDTRDNLQFNTTHEIIIEGSAEIEYTGDRLRLEQVLDNLLRNAIKYSPEAEKVIVKSRIEDESIIVSVHDFGIGIAPENLNKLFDRYYRVDNTAMRFDGLGLGLYISSEIIKGHNGSLWIESELGKGSTFFFRLPLTPLTKRVLIRTTDHYQDNHITITHNKEKGRLDVYWIGFQDKTTVEQGCMLMLEYLKKHQLSRVFNDNSMVKGGWGDAIDWVGSTWFPMMQEAGLKYFAHVMSPSTFSQLSARKIMDQVAGTVTSEHFTEPELAAEWIDMQQ